MKMQTIIRATAWLTQAQKAMLFGCSQDNIDLHLKNIYSEREIEQDATTEEISVVRFEGNRKSIKTDLTL